MTIPSHRDYGLLSLLPVWKLVQILREKEEILILEKVLFETGSDVIDQQSYGLLDEVSAVMKKHPELVMVEVAGHTDSVGSTEFNLELSKNRASAVRNYLVNSGVDKDRMIVEYYGETKPIAPNMTEGNRKLNRRVEMRFVWE